MVSQKIFEIVIDNVHELSSKTTFFDLGTSCDLNWKYGVKKYAPYGMQIFFGYLLCKISCNISIPLTCITKIRTSHIQNISVEEIKKKLTFDKAHAISCVLCVPWKNVIEENEVFPFDKKVFLEVKLLLPSEEEERLSQFFDPNLALADVAFIIRGQRIYSHRQFLALHSDYFKAMFYSEFIESKNFEICLEDVDEQQFVELLQIIYPPGINSNTVNYKNVNYILQLADKYSFTVARDKCEELLLNDSKGIVPVAKKMMIADKYRLQKLQKSTIDKLSLNQIKNLLKENEVADFSKDSLLLILNKLFEFL